MLSNFDSLIEARNEVFFFFDVIKSWNNTHRMNIFFPIKMTFDIKCKSHLPWLILVIFLRGVWNSMCVKIYILHIPRITHISTHVHNYSSWPSYSKTWLVVSKYGSNWNERQFCFSQVILNFYRNYLLLGNSSF